MALPSVHLSSRALDARPAFPWVTCALMALMVLASVPVLLGGSRAAASYHKTLKQAVLVARSNPTVDTSRLRSHLRLVSSMGLKRAPGGKATKDEAKGLNAEQQEELARLRRLLGLPKKGDVAASTQGQLDKLMDEVDSAWQEIPVAQWGLVPAALSLRGLGLGATVVSDRWASLFLALLLVGLAVPLLEERWGHLFAALYLLVGSWIGAVIYSLAHLGEHVALAGGASLAVLAAATVGARFWKKPLGLRWRVGERESIELLPTWLFGGLGLFTLLGLSFFLTHGAGGFSPIAGTVAMALGLGAGWGVVRTGFEERYLEPLMRKLAESTAAHPLIPQIRELEEKGEFLQAVKLWQQVVKEQPDSLDFRRSLARSLLAAGDSAQAGRQFQAVTQVLAHRRDFAAAALAYREQVESTGVEELSENAYTPMGEWLRDNDQADLAVPMFKRAVEAVEDPWGQYEMFLKLGDVLCLQGANRSAAEQVAQRARIIASEYDDEVALSRVFQLQDRFADCFGHLAADDIGELFEFGGFAAQGAGTSYHSKGVEMAGFQPDPPPSPEGLFGPAVVDEVEPLSIGVDAPLVMGGAADDVPLAIGGAADDAPLSMGGAVDEAPLDLAPGHAPAAPPSAPWEASAVPSASVSSPPASSASPLGASGTATLADALDATARRAGGLPDPVGQLPAPGQTIPSAPNPSPAVFSNDLMGGPLPAPVAPPATPSLQPTPPPGGTVSRSPTGSYELDVPINAVDGLPAHLKARKHKVRLVKPTLVEEGVLRYEDYTGFSGMAFLESVQYIAVANLQSGGPMNAQAHAGATLVLDLVLELTEQEDTIHCVAVRMSAQDIDYGQLLPQVSDDPGTNFGQLLVLLRGAAPQALFVPSSGFVPSVPDSNAFGAAYIQHILAEGR